MTTQSVNRKQVGAAVDRNVHWHQLRWDQVHKTVRRLQKRIVEAQKQGRLGKVKALQRLLTHSFSAKALAVRKVTENQGSHTPGIDGQIWDNATKKSNAIASLRQRGYRAKPLRRVYIPKANGKRRPLGIPTLKDRAMQALYALALEPVAETTADGNSYGFRTKRSTADAKEQCFLVLARTTSANWVLEADIKACFDQISHQWLLEHIPMEKAVLSKWLKAGYLEKGFWQPTQEGTPQGSVISPLLANLTLDGLEGQLQRQFVAKGKTNPKVHLVRYCDDFIITGDSYQLLETQVKPLVETFLGERGLVLSVEKTHITHIDEGFDFLGFNFRKYSGKLLIKPTKKNVKAIVAKLGMLIKQNRQATAEQLIRLLNPVLQGWCNYYRHAVSYKTFATIRYRLFRILWHWCKRRHPQKAKRWIKQRYFTTVGKSNWEFFARLPVTRGSSAEPSADGQATGGERNGTRNITLFNPTKVKIQRHIKVRTQANPFDAAWESYFEEREDREMLRNLKERKQLYRLWQQQQGRCPMCKQRITRQTGWHNHHIVWRVNGGSDRLENRVLLHPVCHQQVHQGGVTVSKPRSPHGSVKKA